ncbi:MAG TPA: cation-transporting P-type ATPase, partial [Alphaproteobacteria bacterium]
MARAAPNRTATGLTPPPEPRRRWHAESIETVLAAVEATPEGLTQAAVEARLARHGPNRLTPPRPRGALARLLAQFHNVLIDVLLVAAAVTAGLGHWTDSAVIAAVVVV